jgi:hypothetical protein
MNVRPTLTAIDENGNPIENYRFKVYLTMKNSNPTHTEVYYLNNVPYSVSAGPMEQIEIITLPPTDSNGEVTLDIDIPGSIPSTFDEFDYGVFDWRDADGNDLAGW